MAYNSQNTEHILNALTSMDLLEKKSGCYKNREIASLYLSRHADGFVGDTLIAYDAMAGFKDIDIERAVIQGPDGLYKDKNGLEAHKMYGDYTETLKKTQRIGRGKEICALVKKLPEFKHFNKMLDLGGGPGLISIAIGQEKEDLQGVIFDTPKTIVVAKECIEDYQMTDRFSTLSGDYLKDAIGSEYDFVLAIGTLNFAKNNLNELTHKIYNSLNEGGVFMSISDGIVAEGTKPASMVLGWLPTCLKGLNACLYRGQISQAALKSGFKTASRETVDLLRGQFDVEVFRK